MFSNPADKRTVNQAVALLPATTHSTYTDDFNDRIHARSKAPWRTNFLRRLPWDAFAALLVGIGCAFAMVFIIVQSDGDLVENWRLAPGVYLAIASVLANIMLRYTFDKGVEISWWITALRQDRSTTVADLHGIWTFGTSLWSALVAGRGFNRVALAAILLSLVPVNAPLVQRASRTVSRHTVLNFDVPIVAAPFLNATTDTTGMITGRSHQINFITPSFASVLQDHLLATPIRLEGSLCRGGKTCRGILKAAGYSMACVNGTEFFDKTPRMPNEIAEDGNSAFNESVIFSTNLAYMVDQYQKFPGEPIVNLTAKFKKHGQCKGNVAVRNCTMAPATLEYHVVIANGTIALDRGYTYEDDRLVNYTKATDKQVHGGIFITLQSMFSAMVTLRFAGAVGYDMSTSGITALRYSRQGAGDASSLCQNQDPTHDILMTARELIFRLALQSNNTDVVAQSVRVSQRGTEVVYTSDFLFLGLALMLIGLSAISVLPLLMYWWRLGRDVSLSPVEIARAFSAPELMKSGSNSDAGRLMKDIGAKEVRYGVVSSKSMDGDWGQVTSELAFAHPSVAQAPQKGELY
ncbi:hypothetical protein ACHAQI_012109 [Fusarium lateritium]